MPVFDPQEIAQWTNGTWIKQAPESISGFCFDARQLEPGQCFVALSGGARDGHEFLQQAMEQGAVAALVEKPAAIDLPQLQVKDSLLALGAAGAAVRRNFAGPVVGVTGSCGKTSTKEMLRTLLGAKSTHATAGNWNNRIGVPMTLLGLHSTGDQYAVIEAGINQPGEMELLGKMIQADLNVLTNIAPAHLELLDTLENVATEKSWLLRHAKADSLIVLPAEVLRYPAYASYASRALALMPKGGETPDCDARELIEYELEYAADGMSQWLSLEGQRYQVFSPSRGIVANAALAIVAAKRLGIAETEISARMASWRPAGSRGRVERLGSQSFYIDCYNANPASMADALEAFACSATPDDARFYILGAMNELGQAAVEQHTAIGGLLALRPQDQAAFVGPKSLTQAYAAGARAAGAEASQLICSENIENLKTTVAPFEGALFLKGSRSYQLEQLLPQAIQG